MGIAEVLERVMPFGTEGIPIKAYSSTGLSQSELFPSPGGHSQMKRSSPGLIQILVAAQPLYRCLSEQGASWSDLLRGLQQDEN